MSNKVFLGGTCNGSTWRDELIQMLKIDYFNPVVPDWTPECQQKEIAEKQICKIHLYVITPQQKGLFTPAEIIDSSYNKQVLTVVGMIGDFDEAMKRSVKAVCDMAKKNGAIVLNNLGEIAYTLNAFKYADLKFRSRLLSLEWIESLHILGTVVCAEYKHNNPNLTLTVSGDGNAMYLSGKVYCGTFRNISIPTPEDLDSLLYGFGYYALGDKYVLRDNFKQMLAN
jgi:hypothetical protein